MIAIGEVMSFQSWLLVHVDLSWCNPWICDIVLLAPSLCDNLVFVTPCHVAMDWIF